MSMNINQAEKALMINTRAGNATLLCSPSGYGKSTMCMSAFVKLKADYTAMGKTIGLGIIFAATQTPPDLIGYQFKGERTFKLPSPVQHPNGTVSDTVTVTVTDPSVPLWMLDVFTGKPASMFDMFVVLIEEYGQGEPDTKRALAEIFLNGGTAPWYLPPGSARWGATNSGTRYGVTKDFLFAISRRTLIDIVPDVDVLVSHWDKPYSHQGREWQPSAVWKAWAKTSGQSVIFEKEPKEDGPWCNPRTMMAADRIYQVMEEENGGRPVAPDDPLLLDLFAGTIGMPATMSCLQHLQFRTELPSYSDIIADPAKAMVPTRPDLKLLMVYELANQTKPADMDACISYMKRINAKDMEVTYVMALMRRDHRAMFNLPALQAWISANSALLTLVTRLQ